MNLLKARAGDQLKVISGNIIEILSDEIGSALKEDSDNSTIANSVRKRKVNRYAVRMTVAKLEGAKKVSGREVDWMKFILYIEKARLKNEN